jgi:hypothetical protein
MSHSFLFRGILLAAAAVVEVLQLIVRHLL